MHVALAYHGRSELREGLLSLAPNVARDAVSFDAALRQPVRFREAISALHDVVIGDLRRPPRDKSAYQQWKSQEREREAALRRATYEQARDEILARRGEAVPPDLERRYAQARRRYWAARREYSAHLLRHAPDLWRKLVPCDPVITVAEDVVFFECFSADESSYGCLTADREAAFGTSTDLQYGTTNVDYSWDLYHHFQGLRSYRPTRFRVNPAGFEVAVRGSDDYREEKIDLPVGWLRGFMQIQSAMTLPMRQVSLSREAVYGLLAWLKRHRETTGPRAVRFELLDGRPPALVLEPWGERIVSHATTYHGAQGEPIRIWGRRRLMALARALPLAERFDVHLLGTGLPSFWVARMGDMRLTLGLSGWTANDWTRGSALDLLAPPAQPPEPLIQRLAGILRQRRADTFANLQSQSLSSASQCAAALRHLAHSGQVIYDLSASVYRWRQIMPRAVGEAEMGPEDPEAIAARQLAVGQRVTVASRQDAPDNGRLIAGEVEGKRVEVLLDADGGIRRAKCTCSHHYRFGIRKGPCRHILALRQVDRQGESPQTSSGDWYDRLRRWANN